MNKRFLFPSRAMTMIWSIAAASTLLLPASAYSALDESAHIRKFESSLLPAFSVEGEPEQRWTVSDRMEYWKVPGMSIAVIRGGRVAWAKGYGVLQVGKPSKVNTQTVFSVGSVSKVGAAVTALRLVDAGKLDLERDVNSYLSRWRVPDSIYTTIRPVTLRGILSHTAGFSVHGFKDFLPGEVLPEVTDTLEGRSPAKNAPVRVEYLPGSKYQYSGGGTTVEQLIIEEVTGLGFAQAARHQVFEPLGMARSTYENPLPSTHGNIAKAHGRDGMPRALPRGYEAMPEIAASGLWTTPTDYAQLVIALMRAYQGQGNGFLSQMLARQMLTEVWPSKRGLGPALEGTGKDRRFSHGGSNDSYKAHMEGHPNTGNGVIVFTNSANGSALIDEVVRAVAAVEGWSPALSNHQWIRPIALSPVELGEMVGVYAEDKKDGMLRRIIYKDGSLYSKGSNEEDGFKLIPVDPANFVFVWGELRNVRFVRGYDGQIVGMLREQGDEIIMLKKIASR